MNDTTVLVEEDIKIIETAIANCANNNNKIWDEKELEPIKQKIKAHYRGLLGERCCYCSRNTHGEFKMVLDIEHILPKSKYLSFALSPFNLSIACKRCNMNIKGEDCSFLNDEQLAHANPEDAANYKFIHPNFDNYFSHLGYESSIKNDKKLIKYTVVDTSAKGKYTYEYFELSKLEFDSYNQAQGIETKITTFSDLLSKEEIKEIERLLGELKRKYILIT